MKPLLLAFPDQIELCNAIASYTPADRASLTWHHFPDDESLVAVNESVRNRKVAIVASLNRPDRITLPLLFAARTARELGAKSVGLIAPYLAYMRQDRRFHPGEAISARLYTRMLDDAFDWLVTADPHLHRIDHLNELFTVPARQVSTVPLLARWIRENVDRPLIIGPDSESRQWVMGIAEAAQAPFQVLEKRRHGDREVEVSLPDAQGTRDRTPVIADDIVSSGTTMIETIRHLAGLGLPAPVCLVIHPVFSGYAYRRLQEAGTQRIVSTDTVPHPSNAISTAQLFAEALREFAR